MIFHDVFVWAVHLFHMYYIARQMWMWTEIEME